jgi:glycosyltransferase involved in cell wall biosynthesis
MVDSKRPVVSVVMITYMHEALIGEAIDGVLIQQCNFDVELIIADDCSPDKTRAVVESFKEHPNYKWINYIRHDSNKGMMGNFIWAVEQASSKYIALCEGDDYWTDPLKLQKQLDFMEANEEYVCVGGKVKILDTRNETNKLQYGAQYFEYSENQKISIEALLDKVKLPFHTSTYFFVRGALNLLLFESLFIFSISGDVPLLQMLNAKGSMYYINEEFGVQHHNSGGITRSAEHKGMNFLWNRVYMWEHISSLYNQEDLKILAIDNNKYFKRIFTRKLLNVNLTDQISFYKNTNILHRDLVKIILVTLVQKVLIKLRLKR